MKRFIVPILSIAVLALAGLPTTAWADPVPADTTAAPVDTTAAAPVDTTTAVPTDSTVVPADQVAAPILAASQGGPPGGGGSVAFSKFCQGVGGTGTVGAGSIDRCGITLSQGTLSQGAVVTIVLQSPQGSITDCNGFRPVNPSQCSFSVGGGTAPMSIGSETFTISPTARPNTPVMQVARACATCSYTQIAVSGPGSVVGGGGPILPPPSPYVTKFCSGPNNDGTVYQGQRDSCTVSAGIGDTFHAGNRVTVTPPGEAVAGCLGVPGITSATENFERKTILGYFSNGISCSFTVLAGATVTPGQMVGTELINVPLGTPAGTPFPQGVSWCSDASNAICGPPPGIQPTGPGAVVSADPPFTVTGNAISATEGQAFSGTVGAISDADPGASPSEYVADIGWGDGTQTQARLDGWSVVGSHTYLEEGTYNLTVSVTDRDQDHTIRSDGSPATVVDAPLTAQGRPINTTNPFTGSLATFSDADPNGAAADYTLTVDWGDGTTSPATASPNGTGFDVTAMHGYIDLGPYKVTVHVCDAGGACADATSNFLVFAYTTGGNFVIGDGNAAPGSRPTFWGAQWADANAVSGGAAPAAFKGFADNPSGPLNCGTGWSTSPGNSAHPPDTVPSYTAVIVASSINQDGPRISGDGPQVVIVKTDPGYAPDPGHTGTGTVVAGLCP